MSRLKMAVIGVGALGRHHARILANLDTVELIAVADTDGRQARQVAESHGTRYVLDYRDLVQHVEAVSIAVPTVLHRPVAAEFLKHRIPVLVEKPLAAGLSEARHLTTLAQQQQTVLQVGHVERFNPVWQAARPLIGQPKYIRAERLSPYTFRSTDIGVVHDLMIHDLDLILAVVGDEIDSVEALGVSVLGGHEDCAQARLRFRNGCVADLTASRVNPDSKRSMQIWSVQGCLNVDFAARRIIRYAPSETLLYGPPPLERAHQPDLEGEDLKNEVFGTFLKVTEPPVGRGDALTTELSSFVECVQSNGHPEVDGEQGLAAMQAADQVLASLTHHRWTGQQNGPIGPFLTMPELQKRAG